MSHGCYTLARWTIDPIEMTCARCARFGRYRRQALIDRFGAAVDMPHLLTLVAKCPHKGNFHMPCGIHYVRAMDQRDVGDP